jgi:radical SAM superfamily enzyme YgiQ (UPF0313 family)
MTSRYALLESARSLLLDEQGTLLKEAELKVALCYPSPYHVGMSSLGFQTIYREVHAHPAATAERAFLPDDVEAFKASRTPLFTLERQQDVGSFEVLAFSVAYELELAGLFEMLELSGLSPFRAQRPEAAPLVIAGGPLTFSNPDPLEPFVDLLLQGEAEDLIHVLLDAVLEHRGDKEAIRRALAQMPGFRAPGLSPGIEPLRGGQGPR